MIFSRSCISNAPSFITYGRFFFQKFPTTGPFSTDSSPNAGFTPFILPR